MDETSMFDMLALIATVIAAVVGVAGATVIAVGSFLARGQRENARQITEMIALQARMEEHQAGQDDKLERVLGRLDKLSDSLGQVPCVKPQARCRPSPIITDGDRS